MAQARLTPGTRSVMPYWESHLTASPGSISRTRLRSFDSRARSHCTFLPGGKPLSLRCQRSPLILQGIRSSGLVRIRCKVVRKAVAACSRNFRKAGVSISLSRWTLMTTDCHGPL